MDHLHISPEFHLQGFNCPHCGAYANQVWNEIYISNGGDEPIFVRDTYFANCAYCKEKSIWLNENMIYPLVGTVPIPNQDLPSDIIDDYLEARNILNLSPRGSSALLRLAIEKLCKVLGENGKDINENIANLVKKGLPIKIQQALDYVRVVGNNAVHPGHLDLKDNQEVASNLFKLINIIAEVMISQPKHIDQLYDTLPQSQKEAILRRDSGK
ncbi:DUF4145 domain-containing protein [Aquirufa nivalisilvae]